MKWKIETLSGVGVIRTTVTGTVNASGLQKASSEVYKLAQKEDITKLLTDYRNASVSMSVMEIYNLPDTLKQAGRTHQLKSSVVISKDSPNRAEFEFFKTRCINTSSNFAIFSDYDEAFQWLISAN